MSRPPISKVLLAGFLGGLILNAVDTPWSVFVMVPRLQAFADAHQLVSHPLVGPWFLASHFGLTTTIAWIYSLARAAYGPGPSTALLVAATILLLNRAFGLANVLMGLMPAGVFLGFSVSFVIGTLFAGIVIGRVVDRANRDPEMDPRVR